ncbi:hypothetical protein [Gallaecimonas mangrovi]|uniref:hypothetical protein n=1 Tax=Gallaecimonas mangrovi TaxID=2291597 RepID=UPI000E209CB1|nr:hypothetical protein [Gallaecimonas mangrovi]
MYQTQHKQRLWLAAAILGVLLLITGCNSTAETANGNLSFSEDNNTYLLVTDANEGRCKPLLFDGSPWVHGFGERVAITPGKHVLSCGTTVTFNVPKGTVFHFKHWQPSLG